MTVFGLVVLTVCLTLINDIQCRPSNNDLDHSVISPVVAQEELPVLVRVRRHHVCLKKKRRNPRLKCPKAHNRKKNRRRNRVMKPPKNTIETTTQKKEVILTGTISLESWYFSSECYQRPCYHQSQPPKPVFYPNVKT